MNRIRRILLTLTESDLREAVFELERLEKTGLLEMGILRSVARQIHEEEAGITISDAQKIVELFVLREAAKRWANQTYLG